MSAGLDIAELAGHVKDANYFHFPGGTHVMLPKIGEIPLVGTVVGYIPVVGPWLVDFQITKFMVIELVAAILMFALFFPMAAKLRTGKPLKGRFWNMIEVFLVYLRDQVIVPSIGKKHAGPFIPYLWTLFFFILFCNLGGMIPWMGSPTGSISVTAILALCTFGMVTVAGMKFHGVAGYWLGLVPHMDLPAALSIMLKPMMFGIEVAGLLIKHVVLAVRLMANMFAGHLVLAVFLAFIPMTVGMLLVWVPVTIGSVTMCVALSMLELFVAFLQAYIFMFLSALFIGMSVHQH